MKKNAAAAPRSSIEDGQAAARGAQTREEMQAAIDSLAASIRGVWYELRTEERVQETARIIAARQIGLDPHDILLSYRAGRDLIIDGFPHATVVETSASV